jgi:hypothetical protein
VSDMVMLNEIALGLLIGVGTIGYGAATWAQYRIARNEKSKGGALPNQGDLTVESLSKLRRRWLLAFGCMTLGLGLATMASMHII